MQSYTTSRDIKTHKGHGGGFAIEGLWEGSVRLYSIYYRRHENREGARKNSPPYVSSVNPSVEEKEFREGGVL